MKSYETSRNISASVSEGMGLKHAGKVLKCSMLLNGKMFPDIFRMPRA